jgi:hypothetical protein
MGGVMIQLNLTARPDGALWEITVKPIGHDPWHFYVEAGSEKQALDAAMKVMFAHLGGLKP